MAEQKRKWRGIFITVAQLNALPEYSRSVPTGVYPGKFWKREYTWRKKRGKKERKGWIICSYEEHPDPKMRETHCKNGYYVPLIVKERVRKFKAWWQSSSHFI